MIAEIVADDGIVIALDAVMQTDVIGKVFAAAHRHLIAFIGVMIGEHLRPVGPNELLAYKCGKG